MKKEVVLKQKNITIEYNAEHNFLYCNWTGFQTVDSIMESGEKILEIFKAKKCAKVLNDNRQVSGPWQKASEWTANNWFPRMLEAGLTHFAWIFSENIFAQLSAQKAMPDTQMVKKFNSYEAAEEWLVSAKSGVSAK